MNSVAIGLLLLFPSRPETTFAPLGPVVSFDEVGLYSVGCVYRDGHQKTFPVGWSGDFDDTTGVACRPNGQGITLLHCPWRGGTGVSYQEFTVRIPKVRSAKLTGAIAMGTNAVGKSDGATFRVFVNGQKLLDENRKDDVWKEFSLDVSRFSGATATIRFETDPGARDDASYDFSLWKNRRLVLTGMPVSKRVSYPVPPANLGNASSVGSGDVVPVDGDLGINSTISIDSAKIFQWKGNAGIVSYVWERPKKPGDPIFGMITLQSQMGEALAINTRLGSSARIEWVSEARQIGSHLTQDGVQTDWLVGGKSAHLQIVGKILGKSLVMTVSCDQPVVREFDAGTWGPVAYRRHVTVPYYSGQVQYLPEQDLFVNSFLDWTKSGASWQDGSRAIYGALTNGSRNLLKERAVFSASWHLAGALPSIPNPKSPFLKQVGGRIMLDSWGGKFSDIAAGFSLLGDYGIRDCAAIVHAWQRSGYDNALPAHYPADASLGGEAEMRHLVETGTDLGYLVSLHENYVDYYPNFEGFDENDIALDASGKRVLAWYQPGTKIQSFAVKPNAILRLAATQSPEIHRRYGTNANYLDVHSAVPPWFHVDHQASEDGAGTFRQVWDTHRKLWAYERKTHGGPVFGEGNNHWFWSGLLDGVEAQFGSGWPGSEGTTAPLMVDFDLLRVHPLQANHGMGYYERWWPCAPWGAIPPMSILDQYRMQEVAFGHTGFLGGSTWNILPFAWLEHHLLTPVTAAYAGVRPSKIEYRVGGQWVSNDVAARTGQWDRVRVTYANGLVIVANSSPSPLQVGALTLPQFGWSATGAGVKAWTALKDGAFADYAETTDRVFANARNAAHWNVSNVHRIRPRADGFLQTGPRRFRLTYKWTVGESLDRDYTPFVHFWSSGADEGIRFQGDHRLAKPTSTWSPNSVVEDGPWDVTIPESVLDGNYAVTIGLYQPGGSRLQLEGPADGTGRIQLGTILVKDSGQTIRFSPISESGDQRLEIYKKDLNQAGKVVDFGTLRTNGSVNLVRKGKEWVMQTFPRHARFELELSVAKFGAPKEVACLGVKSLPFKPTVKNGYWRISLNSAREYRWLAKP